MHMCAAFCHTFRASWIIYFSRNILDVYFTVGIYLTGSALFHQWDLPSGHTTYLHIDVLYILVVYAKQNDVFF